MISFFRPLDFRSFVVFLGHVRGRAPAVVFYWR
jgi:hypothetical protein